jgi:hypothetical protein
MPWGGGPSVVLTAGALGPEREGFALAFSSAASCCFSAAALLTGKLGGNSKHPADVIRHGIGMHPVGPGRQSVELAALLVSALGNNSAADKPKNAVARAMRTVSTFLIDERIVVLPSRPGVASGSYGLFSECICMERDRLCSVLESEFKSFQNVFHASRGHKELASSVQSSSGPK